MEEGLAKNLLVGVREWTNAKLSNRLKVVRLTRAQYQALISAGEIDDYTIYIISLTASFVNWNSATLYTTAVAYGNTPVYAGPTPTRPEDIQNQIWYEWNGWSPSIGPITQDTTFTAQYISHPYYIFIFDSQDPSIVSSEVEINGETVTSWYADSGDSVTITFRGVEHAPETYVIDYWEDDLGNRYTNGQTYTITANSDMQFIVYFREISYYTLSFAPIGYDEFNGDGNQYGYIKVIPDLSEHPELAHGTVSVEYEGSYTDAIDVPEGSNVTIIPYATPDNDSELYSWSDGLTQSTEITIQNVRANKTYYARFIPQGAHIATVQANNSEYGQVSIYQDYFERGDVERIVPVEGCEIYPIAKENQGYEFLEWVPWLDNTTPQTIYIDEDTVYTAIFQHSGGTPTTSTLTFNSACGGTGIADDGTKWVVTSDANESAYDTTKGIHYGTSSVKVQYINLIQDVVLSGPITQVVVNASTASGVTATLSVTVDGVAFGTTQSLTQTATNYTFTGQATGVVEVTIQKQQQAAKALYCKSITVTYLA